MYKKYVVAAILTIALNAWSLENPKKATTHLTKTEPVIIHKRTEKKISTSGSQRSIIETYPSDAICKGAAARYSREEFEIRNCLGCKITFNLAKGTTYDTGHESGHSGTHPIGKIVGKSLGVQYTIGSNPYFYEYEAPDVSVEIELSTDLEVPNPAPYPPSFVSIDYTILAYVPGLVNADTIPTLILFDNITSHPDNGTYLTPDALGAITFSLIDYKDRAETIYSVPTGSIVRPKSEGASLKYGGLFDVNKNFINPHCTHREGTDIDIGMSLFNASSYSSDLKNALEGALLDAGFTFPVPIERPAYLPSTHWHSKYTL